MKEGAVSVTLLPFNINKCWKNRDKKAPRKVSLYVQICKKFKTGYGVKFCQSNKRNRTYQYLCYNGFD